MSPRSFFLFLCYFLFFTSKIKTGMGCYGIPAASLFDLGPCAYNSVLFELMLFNLGPCAKSLLFVYSPFGTFYDPLKPL